MSKKTYRVTGDSVVAGNTKGDEFKADYTDEQAQALIDGGHIKEVNQQSNEAKKEA